MNPMISSRNYTPQQSLSGLFETGVRKQGGVCRSEENGAAIIAEHGMCIVHADEASCITETRA